MTIEDTMAGGAPALDAPFKYRAFISYRHADKAWGDWLHKSLESYRVPRELVRRTAEQGGAPARLGRVFRDREELSASHDLGADIQEALRASANLVVICSPLAARSRWVNEEILAFKRLGRGDRIFPIVVAGEPNAADPNAECFPPALKYQLGPDGALTDRLAEPIAADARDSGDGRDNARLKLIAGLLGVDYDQLRRRQLEAERRAFRRFIAVAASLVLVFAGLAAAAGWFYLDAERQRAEAVRQRDRAEAAVDSARGVGERLTRNLVQKLRDTEGVQAKVLQEILAEVGRLMDELAAGGEVGADEKMTQAWTHCELVESRIETGDLAGALADATACIEGLEAVAAASPAADGLARRRTLAFIRRGEVRLRLSDLAGAEADFTAALGLAERQAAARPDDRQPQRQLRIVHIGLGRVHAAQGDLAAARRDYEAALAIARRLSDADPGDIALLEELALAYDYVSDSQADQGDLAAARATLEEGLAIRRRLAEARPGDTDILVGLAVSLFKLGNVLLDLKDPAAALERYRESLAICERLAAADPSNAGYRDNLALAHGRVGAALLQLGDFAGALASYQTALEIRERLCAVDPADRGCRRSLSLAHANVGDARFLLGDLDGARASYAVSLEIAEGLAAEAPDNALYARDLSQRHWKLVLLGEREGDLNGALVHARKARDIIAPLAAKEPSNATWRADLARLEAKIAELEGKGAAAPP